MNASADRSRASREVLGLRGQWMIELVVAADQPKAQARPVVDVSTTRGDAGRTGVGMGAALGNMAQSRTARPR